ncbi:MAG: hypothetical protein OQK69_03755 [Gammaproteobacteria bacterium]|nr:hypothetical protein [Gammaproteobacteria bacterium]
MCTDINLKSFIIFFALLVTGCSPFRIVEYKTYDDTELGNQEPAIIFVSKIYGIKSIDGREISLTPLLAGVYGGRHIYMTPGKHTITLDWGNRNITNKSSDVINFEVSSGRHYKLTSSINGEFGIFERKKPMELPDSTWGYRI